MKVSVVIPVYNASESLTRCLGSLAAQTFRDFEVIAVDDGSTDGSGDVLEAAVQQLPLRVIHQPNQGQSVARNTALSLAQGDYVLMLDADDFIHPQTLELTVRAAERDNLDFVLFDYRNVTAADCAALDAAWRDDRISATAERIDGRIFEWFLGLRRAPMPWQFLFRRATLAGLSFVPGFIYEDVPFVLTYLNRRACGGHLHVALYAYVRLANSTTHADNWLRRIAGYERGLRELRRELDDRRFRLYVKEGCARWLRRFWHAIRELPAVRRTPIEREFRRFLVRCRRDGLLRATDFSGFWKVRFLFAVWRERGVA